MKNRKSDILAKLNDVGKFGYIAVCDGDLTKYYFMDLHLEVFVMNDKVVKAEEKYFTAKEVVNRYYKNKKSEIYVHERNWFMLDLLDPTNLK